MNKSMGPCEDGAFPSASLSQASTACASPKEDDADAFAIFDSLHACQDAKCDDDDDAGTPDSMPPYVERPAGRKRKDRPERPGDCEHSGSYFDSSDDACLGADASDDTQDRGAADEQHADVVVGEDEMQARVADAMRGLHRLHLMNIDPRELPTIHTLYVRWCIAQWALEGPAGRATSPPAMPCDDWSDTEVRTQPIAVGSCSKEERSAPQRKRYRENEADIAEDMQLGKIWGNGCGIVKACRMLPQPPAL